MPAHQTTARAADSDLVSRILARDQGAFESLMRQHNGRLFRVARAILKDDAEAEDALQDAYFDAYRHIDSFRGDSQLGTWLVRVVANHALMRLRKQKKDRVVVPFQSGQGDSDSGLREVEDPAAEQPVTAALRTEVRKILERRIDQLPMSFRTVFVMREVEEMSVEETAAALNIPPATVRSRLFRARGLLRAAVARDLDLATGDVFGFAGSRCDRIVAAVLARIERERGEAPPHQM